MIYRKLLLALRDPEVKETTVDKNAVKMKTRILSSVEYLTLRKKSRDDFRACSDNSSLLGMIHVDHRIFVEHPDRYDGSYIKLPSYGFRKQKLTIRQRYARLFSSGKSTIGHLWKTEINNDMPNTQGLHNMLKTEEGNCGVSCEEPNINSHRKTWDCTYCPRRLRRHSVY